MLVRFLSAQEILSSKVKLYIRLHKHNAMRNIILTLCLLFSSPLVFAQQEQKIQSLHIIDYTSDAKLETLIKQLPQLAEMGINMLMLEVDYNFQFITHPELIENDNPITKAGAKRFAEQCKKYGIRLIPEFQCIGHQSWKGNTFSLLRRHPELDLTPGAFPGNDSIYCREWDITNPKVNEIILPMIDEIIEAFDADGIHLGMDELFLIGHPKSPNTKGKNPAKLLAVAINEFHDHFVKEKKLQMFMWGDRLINAADFNYGIWEASAANTADAVNMIPKDIIICDWHYNGRNSYPSINMFVDKGFKVLPCSYKDAEAAKDLIKYSYGLQNPNMIGHCFTTWGEGNNGSFTEFEAMVVGLKSIKEEKFYDVKVNYLISSRPGEILAKLSTAKPELSIYYTIDGTTPTTKSLKYKGSISITSSCILKAQAFNGTETAGEILEEEYALHKGVGLTIKVDKQPSSKYPTNNGVATLLNGISGSVSFSDGEWVGWEGEDITATITCSTDSLESVSVTFHNKINSWIHHAQHIEIYSSNDGISFTKIAEKSLPKIAKQTVNIELKFTKIKTKFLKIKIDKVIIPEGFTGEGNPAWIFIDEIVLQ